MNGRQGVLRGGVLTSRQLEVMWCMSYGQTRREVALAMGIADNTVRNHLRRVFVSLDADSLVAAYRKLGWLRIEQDG